MSTDTVPDGASMTGGDAIVEALLANGVDTVFGLPGAQMYPLFDALTRRSDRITTIGARHEQACGYMAFGYARSTGRPGVYTVVPGPGVLNTAAALCTGWGCNTPMLCITGQVPSQFLGRGRGHLHELPDQLGTLRSLVKWAARIERPADAPAVMAEAFRQMLSGRPGPVAVEMAWDTMAQSEWVGAAAPATILRAPPPPPAIEQAARMLAEAKRPMIMVGSGAQHAAAAVQALAETLDAPVAAFRGGRGIVPEDHPLGISSYAASLLWPETDVLLGIGTRLEMPSMRWTGMMTLVEEIAPQRVIRIDIDPAEMRRLRPTLGIVADAGDATSALLTALGDQKRGGTERRSSVARAKSDAAEKVQAIKPHFEYLQAIRRALPRDGILVEELCQAGFASYVAYPVLAPYTYISPGFQGTLGCGYMTALGVKTAHPDRPVVSIIGDGGLLFGIGEFATAVQHRIGVVTVLFNNGAYGNVLRDQQTGFGGRLIGSELRNPDFQQLAASFGVTAYRVGDAGALEDTLREALATGLPTLIEVMVDRSAEVSPWPFIHLKM